MSVYDDVSVSMATGDAQILGIITKPGTGSLSVDVTFTNTGGSDWTFGIGISIKDNLGQVWNCWTNNLVRSITGNEGSIDTHFCSKNATVTHTVSNIPLNNLAAGPLQFVISLWKESMAPPSTRLARYPTSDGSWAANDTSGNTVEIAATYSGVLGNILFR